MIEIFCKRLKSARQNAHLERKQVAELIGKSVNTIADYENGTSEPSLSILIKFSQMYNCSTDYLLGLDGNHTDMTGLTPEKRKLVCQVIDAMRDVKTT